MRKRFKHLKKNNYLYVFAMETLNKNQWIWKCYKCDAIGFKLNKGKAYKQAYA